MVASLSLMIMNWTQEQDTEALASFMAWPPVPKAEQLQKGIIDMDDGMERLVDGGFDINARLESHVFGKLTHQTVSRLNRFTTCFEPVQNWVVVF